MSEIFLIDFKYGAYHGMWIQLQEPSVFENTYPVKKLNSLLQLTVEDYVQTLEKLTSDMRFTIYIMGYKRILVIWIVLAFVILLSLLFSGFQGIQLFACGVVWLILNAGAIFFCMWIKIKVSLVQQLRHQVIELQQAIIYQGIFISITTFWKKSWKFPL